LSEVKLTQCYIDESVQRECGFVVSAFVFTNGRFDREVSSVLREAGLKPGLDEFKSSTRMDINPQMRKVRDNLLSLASSKTRLAMYVGPHQNNTLGKHSLQALQSVLVRNGIKPSGLKAYFDEDIFKSPQQASRLQDLFHFLKAVRIFPMQDSKKRLGIQVADAVAHSSGQIIKEGLTEKVKLIDIGGQNTGYKKGTKASLGWMLLMTLRSALMTRPMVYNGAPYNAATDPVILDPVNDDPVNYGQYPILMGWGVQVSPEADDNLRRSVEQTLGRIWLGCVH